MIAARLLPFALLAAAPAASAAPAPAASTAASASPLAPGARDSAQPAPAARATRVSAQGTIRSAGERQPIAGARVFATARRGPAWTREAVTGPDGRFVLHDLPGLDFQLTVVASGHQRLDQPTTSSFWRRRRPPTIYLQPTEAGRYRTIVVAPERTQKPAPFRAQLAPDEITALPGSQGDPLRALQNLPGSARIPGGLGLIVLRGATPNQSQVFVGEHPVPRAFHIPGLASVVPAGVLAGLDYIPGNFAPTHGNAVGGLVTLKPRVGRRDGLHGSAHLDIISAGALVEGPVGRGSFLMAARRGYLDLALGALGPEVLGDAYIRPTYFDYQVVFDQPVGPGASLTARLLGAGDDLRYEFGPFEDPTVSLHAAFHRLDLVYRKRLGRWDFLLSPALRFDRGGVASAPLVRRRDDIVGLLRAEMTARATNFLHVTAGADVQIDRHRTLAYFNPDPDSPFPPPEGATELIRGVLSNSGVYLLPSFTAGRFAVSPGLRVSMFTGTGGPEFSVDPRLHGRWTPHERIAVQVGAGRYSQPTYVLDQPTLVVQSPLDSLGIPVTVVLPGAIRYLDPRLEFDPRSRLAMSQALQLSAGAHFDLTDALGLDLTVFHRRVRAGSPTVPEAPLYIDPDSAGVTTGLEVLLRHQLGRRLFGWIAYTLMSSRMGKFVGDRAVLLTAPADFDQRHNLVAVLGYKLPRRWQIGARFRLVTGLPVTPIEGGYRPDHGSNQPVPLYGAPNSARMPLFHQLDVRLDKTWILSRAVVGAYLDVQNLYNRQNAEGLWYRWDFTGTRAVVGVPILPVLGVRVDY